MMKDEKLERRVNIKGVLLIVMPEWERDTLKTVHIRFYNHQTPELMWGHNQGCQLHKMEWKGIEINEQQIQ